ncbi:hypothetical protein DFH06DRAFT_1321233 [Mycena polygramma]|nr:hypothetical protein DFH06DRAFT_1321233 [Mycena polygramma]
MQLPSRSSPPHIPAPSTTAPAAVGGRFPLPPLGPRDCDVLSRARRHHFGPVDTQPHGGSAYTRIAAAANSQWALHRQGQELPVRPGSVVSPQTIYTGIETRPNGQEVYHAVFLNARMLVHNPITGQPGMRNGHAITQLYAAPTGDQPWPFEVPYSPARQLREDLSGYSASVHAELGRQRRYGSFQIGVDRQIERRSNIPEYAPPAPPFNSLILPNRHDPANSSSSLSMHSIRTRRDLNELTGILSALPSWRSAFLNATAAQSATNQAPTLEEGQIEDHTDITATGEEGTEGRRPDTPHPSRALRRVEHSRLTDDSEVLDAAYALAMLKRGRTREVPPATNARLERLQYEARHQAQIGEVDIDGLPRCVLRACRAPELAEQEQGREDLDEINVEEQPEPCGPTPEFRETSPGDADMELVEAPPTTEGGDTDAEGETDEEYVEAREMEPRESALGTAAPTEAAGKYAITKDYFSYSPSTSSSSGYSPAPHFPTRPGSLSPILVDADVTSFDPPNAAPGLLPGSQLNSPPEVFHPVSDLELGEHPTRVSPSLSEAATSGSDEDSIPALSDVSSDSDEMILYRPTLPLPKPTTYAIVDTKSIHDNVRYMTHHYLNPMHAQNQVHLVWVRMEALRLDREKALQDRYQKRNQELLSPLYQLLNLFEQSAHLLDHEASRTNGLIDTDLLEETRFPAGTPEGQQRTKEAESTIDTLLRGMALEFADGTLRVRDSARVVVSKDGQRVRNLSEEAWMQTPMYRAALALLASLCPDEIGCATVARILVDEFTRTTHIETLERGWNFTTTDLHRLTQIPPPYLLPQEYGHLRMLLYLFEKHDQMEVVRVINAVLDHQFRKAAVINHFLHGGLLTPTDSIQHAAGRTKVAQRTVLPQPVPAYNLSELRQRADFFLQASGPSSNRFTQNWVQVGAA